MNNSNNTMFIDRSNYCINILKNEIKKYDVLTNEQEIEQCESMKMGDKSARDKLINSNLRFVFIKAKKYCWGGVDFLDLFQAGTIGLMEAVDRYDATKDVKLLSYASHWIECELLKAVKDHSKHKCDRSVDDTLGADIDSRKLLEVLDSSCENRADWDIRYASALNDIAAQVEQESFPEAIELWKDSITMREQGYCMADVAKKYNIPEEIAWEEVRSINNIILKKLKKKKLRL